MSKRLPMITVTRAADEAGVSRSFLLRLLRDGNAETVELRNPHYRSADPMLVVAVDAKRPRPLPLTVRDSWARAAAGQRAGASS